MRPEKGGEERETDPRSCLRADREALPPGIGLVLPQSYPGYRLFLMLSKEAQVSS